MISSSLSCHSKWYESTYIVIGGAGVVDRGTYPGWLIGMGVVYCLKKREGFGWLYVCIKWKHTHWEENLSISKGQMNQHWTGRNLHRTSVMPWRLGGIPIAITCIQIPNLTHRFSKTRNTKWKRAREGEEELAECLDVRTDNSPFHPVEDGPFQYWRQNRTIWDSPSRVSFLKHVLIINNIVVVFFCQSSTRSHLINVFFYIWPKTGWFPEGILKIQYGLSLMKVAQMTEGSNQSNGPLLEYWAHTKIVLCFTLLS